MKYAFLAVTAVAIFLSSTSAQATTVAIDGGIHYQGYLGVVAPGNAYNVTMGGTNSGGTAVATTLGSVYYGGTNSGGSLMNAEPWSLNVNVNGSSTETSLNALVLDPTALANNKYFGDNSFNQNGYGSTPAPNVANPETAGAQTVLTVTGTGAGQYTAANGSAITTAQSLEIGGLYNYLQTLTTPAALGNAQVYSSADASNPAYPAINYQIAATQIAVWDVLGYHVALNGSSNLRSGGANNGVDILSDGVLGNLVTTAENYALSHEAYAGILASTPAGGGFSGSNPALIVASSPVPEPATWLMQILGMGILGAFIRHRKLAAFAGC